MTRTPEVPARLTGDWTAASRSRVRIRREGRLVCEGIADVVTPDGRIIWVLQDNGGRRLFEEADAYEVWIVDPTDGQNYRISQGLCKRP